MNTYYCLIVRLIVRPSGDAHTVSRLPVLQRQTLRKRMQSFLCDTDATREATTEERERVVCVVRLLGGACTGSALLGQSWRAPGALIPGPPPDGVLYKA